MRDSQHKYTIDPNLFFLSVFYPDLLVNGEVPTPAIAVEGDEMSIDRYGKYSVYFCMVVLWLHCLQVMLSCLSLSENVGYINGQVQPEGKTRNTSVIPKFELHTTCIENKDNLTT